MPDNMPTWKTLRESYITTLNQLVNKWAGPEWETHDRADETQRATVMECIAFIRKDLGEMRVRYACFFTTRFVASTMCRHHESLCSYDASSLRIR